MSLAFDKMSVLPLMNATMNVDKPVSYSAYLGGSTITSKEIVSNNYSNSQVSFTANPPSPSVITDRHMLYKQPVRLTFSGTSPVGSRLLQAGYDSFRQMPLSSIISNLQLTLNNTKMTIELSEVIHEMLTYFEDSREQELLSLSPSVPDQSQQYADLVNTSRNPLAQFGEQPILHVPARGGFTYTLFTNNQNDAIVEATLTEPIFISPMLFGVGDGKGLINVQNMTVSANFDGDLKRLWSHSDHEGYTISNIQVELLRPSLLVNYITPSPTMSIPKSVEYNMEQVEVYTSDANNVLASKAEQVLNSSNIQLNVVPSHLLIFAKERRADRTFQDTDTWLSLESLDLSFANVSGIFSGASKEQLYQMARGNGVNMSWMEWSGEPNSFTSGSTTKSINGRGSVMVVKFGKNIGIQDPAISIGVPGTYNLSVRGRFKNQSDHSINPSLYVVPVYEGILTLQQNQAVQQLAVLSSDDVLKAAQEAESEGAVDGAEYEGGSFFGDLGKAVQKALPYIRKGRKIGQTISGAIPLPQAQAVKSALDIAESVGLGQSKGKKGGVLVGGKTMSRAELKKRLMAEL